MSDEQAPGNAGAQMGTGMLALFWVGVLALGSWFFADVLGVRSNPNGSVEGSYENGIAEVRLRANPQGHYVASGLVNGRDVTLLVDTGATSVAVPEAMAARLGLRRGPEITLRTANGDATGYLTRIDQLQLGSLVFKDVSASIAPGLNGEILLGMSALGSVEFTQRNGVLTLRQTR